MGRIDTKTGRTAQMWHARHSRPQPPMAVFVARLRKRKCNSVDPRDEIVGAAGGNIEAGVPSVKSVEGGWDLRLNLLGTLPQAGWCEA
jgi:hypothetical protein